MKINKELNRIQQTIVAPKIQRNDYGSFDYRSVEDILQAYKKVQGDTTLKTTSDIVQIGDRFYVKATATLMVEEETIETVAFAREPNIQKGMNESQITGSATSYAKKYALDSLLAIDNNKDVDSIDNKENAELAAKMETHSIAISMIEDTDKLKEYWDTHSPTNKGKEFASLVTKRKKALTVQEDATS